jgi:GMP reductase
MYNSFTYDDVHLIPRFSDLGSRGNADPSVNFLGRLYKLPVIPANMQSVINSKICRLLANNGYFYIMHRFGFAESGESITVNLARLANEENWPLISISTGVNSDSRNDLEIIKSNNWRVDAICIDVAHGFHSKVKEKIAYLKINFPSAKIIAGNVADHLATTELIKWGADAIKVGIGGGSICTTKLQTGFHVPMGYCVADCKLAAVPSNVPIIADGGCKYFGDVAKALVLGAKMVMSGAFFASCIDSPAEILNGQKQYFGSTSIQAKKHNKHIEGRLVEMQSSCSYLDRMEEIKQTLQSSISYAGGNNLNAFNGVKYHYYNYGVG